MPFCHQPNWEYILTEMARKAKSACPRSCWRSPISDFRVVTPIIPSQEPTAMIHVLAIITAKAGQRDKILTAFRANMPAVHAEAGCIEYGPAIDAEGMGRSQTKI